MVVASPRLEDAYRRYLRFCEDYPQEYGVVAAVWSEVFSSEAERPGEVWIRELLSNRYGGRPENYTQAYYAFFFLCHGAATLINMATDEGVRAELRENCIAICDSLIQHMNILQARAVEATSGRA